MVDWNDNNNRQLFREALIEVYPDPLDLEIFVDDALGRNLSEVAGDGTLRQIAFKLIHSTKADGTLENLYQRFKASNQKNPNVQSTFGELERQNVVDKVKNIAYRDWDLLFGQFSLNDLADLQRAFTQAFAEAMKPLSFAEAQPQVLPFTTVGAVRKWLEHYDVSLKGVELAVRFVEYSMTQLARTDSQRDLTVLQEWRNRIAKQFDVKESPAADQKVAYAYLMITLEQHGKDVIAYPELRTTNQESKILFGAQPMEPCSISQVIDHITQWIELAESAPEVSQCKDREVILELFLRHQHIVDDVVLNWKVTINDENVSLSSHRRYLIRSADRISDYQLHSMLTEAWTKLHDCVSQDVCVRFHAQCDCPSQGATLSRQLKNQKPPGLKFLAQLPLDPAKRRSVLGGMIYSPVPIALWSAASTETVARGFEVAFDQFLKGCTLTNFADLATQWNTHCIDYETKPEKHIKLLCDCPDRWPQLPDIKHQKTTDDEDSIAIVA